MSIRVCRLEMFCCSIACLQVKAAAGDSDRQEVLYCHIHNNVRNEAHAHVSSWHNIALCRMSV